jgi:hypothetical protein
MARTVTSIICARYVLNADTGSRVFPDTSIDVAGCRGDLSLWGLGKGCDIDAARGDMAPTDGRGVPDWCGGKRKQMNAVRRIKTADNMPGLSAKRVIDKRRGITRSNHSERKRKE